ncbi:hypothetical protein DPMN_175607 [Dreissena polymorpha]|uniref:Uncharacterized protein n=1 Tax=Dreissena polymorpha TaxID=45954 RepID=A0A9D4IIX5_DREPO|nr:hypothetical protein DPMN_175607 [Dreissena polymorpha]
MFKEKVNARTHTRRTQDHDISPAGLWPYLPSLCSSVRRVLTFLVSLSQVSTYLPCVPQSVLTLLVSLSQVNTYLTCVPQSVLTLLVSVILTLLVSLSQVNTYLTCVPQSVLTLLVSLSQYLPYLCLSKREQLRAQNFIGTNLLTKFHEDRKINVASRVLTRKNAPPPGSHVFQPTGIIFELVQDIIRMNLLTKFHEDRTVNVASRVLTRFYYSHIRKNAPHLGSHFFQANIIIFELIQDIIKTNLLNKFQEDWKINVASRVLTRKNDPPPGGHVFQPTGIILELIQDIIGMNLLTKFYEDQTINVASRVKNAPPLGSHVFQANANVDGAQHTTDDGQKGITKALHEHNVLR